MSGPAPQRRSRVVIIGEQKGLIEMMTPVIEAIPGCIVVGHAVNAFQAVEICQQQRPDLLVLDLMLDGRSSITLLPRIKEICPRIRVLVYAGAVSQAALREALAAGVHGVVEKKSPLAELRAAVQAVHDGQIFFCSGASGQLKELVRGTTTPTPPVLTERERTILRQLAEGHTPREIAAGLRIAVSTVANHRRNLMRKIGLRSTAQLSLYAARTGLVSESVAAHALDEGPIIGSR